MAATVTRKHGRTVAVGTTIARRPPHGSRRAELPHRALASDHDGQTPLGIRMKNGGTWNPALGDTGQGFVPTPPPPAAPGHLPPPEPPAASPEVVHHRVVAG